MLLAVGALLAGGVVPADGALLARGALLACGAAPAGGALLARGALLPGDGAPLPGDAAAPGPDTPKSAPTGSSPPCPSLAGLVTAPVRHNRRRPARRPAGSALLADDRAPLPGPFADGPVMGFM